MKVRFRAVLLAAVCYWFLGGQSGFGADVAELPGGVQAVWDFEKAYREITPTSERVCLNGLWRWQPGSNEKSEIVPSGGWGWFKVPGPWPGISDYMQKDCQTLFSSLDWKDVRLGSITAAWYEREITIPKNWSARRVALQADYINSFATVYVDGKKAGELRFPTGEVDLTPFCKPGQKQTLSMFVVAMPLKGVLLSYTHSASAREVKGAVARRGLCGDVFLNATTAAPRVAAAKVETSFRKKTVTFTATLSNLTTDASFHLRANIKAPNEPAVGFTSVEFRASDLTNGQFAFNAAWMPLQLWDTHTPTNHCEFTLTLIDNFGSAVDSTFPARFGFREFWIDGRDFYLNGSRIFLSAVPLDNAEVGAAWTTYGAARESLRRLQSFGINFVYTHNYGCEPGSHLSFEEILKAADDVGMLVSLSQPHFSHYEWKSGDADRTNGYAEHARFYTSVAHNHPSVVFYSMSHNATGYSEDMNPEMIDGLHDPRDQWSQNNAKLALRAEAIVRGLDPSRIVYHHASGNLGAMHDMNFYPNFVPIQELSDWFGHWSTNGVKPVFMCEYGAPFTWDWTMYRGWYQGQREFGSAKVPWEYCIAEWNAQFLGDRAFQISDAEKINLRWEAAQFRAGNVWHRWDYPVQVGSTRFDECYPIFAAYLADNFRSFRAWGVSGISPWEHEHFWKLRHGADKSRKQFKTDWEHLQRPGFSPDYLSDRYERMDLAYEESDWIPTAAAQALLRNNRPLLSFIGGVPDFTSKAHNYRTGEVIEKQIILINNSRLPIHCVAEWSLKFPGALTGHMETNVATGDQARIPLRFEIPVSVTSGEYELSATVRFSNGETQNDSFGIHILPPARTPKFNLKTALFDPKGETEKWLQTREISFDRVNAGSDLSGYDLLVVGKSALNLTNAAPDISRVGGGLKVLVLEQTSETLERRFGFRVEEYGLRNVFPRVPDHPLLAGVGAEHLRDWRGASMLLPPTLQYEMRQRYGPTVKWCDIPVTRVWRCGNRGNVASVLIEKPTRGDFLPIVDGGYNLQFSPLMEYREGQGVILFCQLDITGRTQSDPVGEKISDNILEYLSARKPLPKRSIAYVGEAAGKAFLESAGVKIEPFNGSQILVVGPQGGRELASRREEIAEFIKSGGNLLLIGADEAEANSFLPFKIKTTQGEHIAAYFEPPQYQSLLTGIAPSDIHNRDPRKLPLVSGGAISLGDGALARAENANVVFCQMAPWQFDGQQDNLRRTRRRVACLVSRLLGNMGASSSTPLLARFNSPVEKDEKRWLDGFYLDQPEEWDDPYRFFRW